MFVITTREIVFLFTEKIDIDNVIHLVDYVEAMRG